MTEQQFYKYEGLGNDFIVIDDDSVAAQIDAARAKALCDRHLGIGADGVLITGVRGGEPFMHVWNADGSIAEMCGNGLRCVAVHLTSTGKVSGSQFTVATGAGPHSCKVLDDGRVQVAMRAATFTHDDLPAKTAGSFIDQPIEAGSGVTFTALSVGNPHAVTFNAPVSERARLGPLVERDPRFAHGVNVEFADIRPNNAMDLSVWERGVGFTLACGTGACAAAAAATKLGRLPYAQDIRVSLPGGDLTIHIAQEGGPIQMTGPARFVFKGLVSA